MTSSSTFTALPVKLDKKRAELEARHAFAKAEAEAKQKHALEIAKAEEQLQIATAKLDAKERLIALSKRGSSVAVSSKAGPINSSIKLMGRRSDFPEAFLVNSKYHLKKMQLGNCAGEKSSSLLKGSVNGNVVRFRNNKAFSQENFEFPQAIPNRGKSVCKSIVQNFDSALGRVVTDRNDFLKW